MLRFRSLRSGSSGNLLLLEGHSGRQRTRLLVDCGISSQRAGLQILEAEAHLAAGIDGLVVTHAHSDHLNYSALRVMSRLHIPIYLHAQTAREAIRRYLNPYRAPAVMQTGDLDLRTFGEEPFSVGVFTLTPVRVPHAPTVTTHAFLVRRGRRRMFIASDFHDPEAVVPLIYNCDLIYLESNHDPELLRLHFNPASLFHLSNPAAGLLLQHAITHSSRSPQAIVLAHLSEERNRPHIALATVREALREAGVSSALRMIAAPRYAASEVVEIDT